MIGKTALVLALGVLVLPSASCPASADPDYLGGRGLAADAREIQQQRLTGEPVRIGSKCFNACIVKLGAANVEIAPDALFSAHASWMGYAPEDLLTPAVYGQMVPECARRVPDFSIEKAGGMAMRYYHATHEDGGVADS